MATKALLAHPGTQYSHQLARQLFRLGYLHEFWTGLAMASDSFSGKVAQSLLPPSVKRKLANRTLSGLPSRYVRTMPTLELKALNKTRKGNGANAIFYERNKTFQEQIPTSSLRAASLVIGFDTSSWVLAERVDKLGKPFVLDQTIAHPQVNQETARRLAKLFPDWNTTLEDKPGHLLACESKEHQLATKVIAASSYTRQSLVENGVAPEKIVVNPYGVDLDSFCPPAQPRRRQPLRFLFVGSISARKGVPLLIKAWEELGLKRAELWLVGPISPKERSLIPDLPGLRVKGKYPLEELPEVLKQCDVLVFPSYCEGFALVLLEALATGLPIITTEATAGPDLITHGVEGLLIPSGDQQGLCDSMKFFVQNESKLDQMSTAARRTAERFSWDSYGDRWRSILSGIDRSESAA